MSHDHHHHQHQQQTAAPISTSTLQQQQQPPQPNSWAYSSNGTNTNCTSYRPCSPDLSAYIPTPPPHQYPQQHRPQYYEQQQQRQQSLFRQSYHDNSLGHSEDSSPSSWHQRQGSSGGALTGLPGVGRYPLATQRGSYDASPYFSPQTSLSPQQDPAQGQLPRVEPSACGSVRGERSNYSQLTYSPTTIAGGDGFSPGKRLSPQERGQHDPQQIQQLPTNYHQGIGQTRAQNQLQLQSQAPIVQSLSSSIPQQLQQLPLAQHNMPPPRRKRSHIDDDDRADYEYMPQSSTGRGAGEGGASTKSFRKRKSDGSQTWTVGKAPGEIGPSLGIDIRTKFPVARIKRIMQADEDVGKVAQATPTAVSKALELFMITLVTKAAAEAKDRSSKRVTAAHIKQAVIKDQTFDFLQEIIEKVPDATDKRGGRAASEEVDDGEGGEDGGGTKRKRALRGKKKADSDED